ncbi:phospholipase A [Xylophilus sp. GOD-11R]|uniref:phospholipase A n=1 Tax=Xylophilus sp. GOD-11R TaxID=3089814 RepID=UPI00298C643E|nr:phospholipase A [Xylophilus sp. GOD-11R]WPB56465.1 phospholipase A [Xylophilus sp. GOD-11R]
MRSKRTTTARPGWRAPAGLAAGTLLMLASPGAFAQSSARPAAGKVPPVSQLSSERAAAVTAWQQCQALTANNARLACFDQWAANQKVLVEQVEQRSAAAAASVTSTPPPGAAASAIKADVTAALATAQPATPEGAATTPTASTGIIGVGLEQGCKDRQFSDLSRFWELESGTSCPTFSLRGFRANSLSAITSSSVNQQPTSENPNNSSTTVSDYRRQELRLQLSVRTKLASGLLTAPDSPLRDSLWLAYSQQSYWQFFNSGLSRPFRSTDYEPEMIYVYPTTASLPFGWKWRYSGAGLVHQSNGQSDPLSRSWNRFYLMTGFEKDNTFSVTGRIWKRLHEAANDDNNPYISNYIGRGEVAVTWNPSTRNTFIATVRGTPGGDARGSGRLEWLRSLGDGKGNSYSGLRFHTQLFSGYGDSLIDYNRKRTVLSVGFSIVDF